MNADGSGRPQVERRRVDRRRSDRRRSDRDEAVPSSPGPETQAADSRFAPRDETGRDRGHDRALVRVARTYAAARALLGVALVLAQAAASLAGQGSQPLVATLCVAYAGLALIIWLLPRYRRLAESMAQTASGGVSRWQWITTIGVDIATFVSLHLLDRVSSFNFAALLVLPVLMSGVLLPRMAALGTAAASALLLLVGAWNQSTAEAVALALSRAGLAGIGLFAIAVLAGELAARLVREEAAARESLELARRQAQLNRLVIQEMADGVLVVDAGLRVRAANPAGRALLVAQGAGPAAPFDLRSRRAWQALSDAAQQVVATRRWPPDGRDVDLNFDDGASRRLRLRVRFTPSTADHEPADDAYFVLLLEDLRTAQARLRQEKLAAMGRVSAGIAHEIRNPLAAISQANALMLEDELRPDQQRLAGIVADNVRRLQRIVDEVMELAPSGSDAPQTIDLRAVVAAAASDFAQTTGLELGPAGRLHVEIAGEPMGVRFDAEHLRRVMVNLLDNALRHAGPEPGVVLLRLSARDARTAILQVLSDGEPIVPEVERHLFEPFFSTRSRGSGLGLYICRELCERYGASIEYRARPAGERRRNEFVVAMRRAPLAAVDAALPLT